MAAEGSCRYSVLFYSQMNFLEEGYRFLPFRRMARKAGERQKNPENPVDPV